MQQQRPRMGGVFTEKAVEKCRAGALMAEDENRRRHRRLPPAGIEHPVKRPADLADQKQPEAQRDG